MMKFFKKEILCQKNIFLVNNLYRYIINNQRAITR
jgi:hypothetical protein